MSSGIITKIKLEPFYQQFLRGFYRNNDPVFKFPREDGDELELAYKFNNLLIAPPLDYKVQDFGNETFLIEVPYQKDKDPWYFNYLSAVRNERFRKDIERAYRFYFHEKMKELRNNGYPYKDCVNLFLDEFNISPQYFDRCIKDFNRWKTLVATKKYLQKSNRVNMSTCPQ